MKKKARGKKEHAGKAFRVDAAATREMRRRRSRAKDKYGIKIFRGLIKTEERFVKFVNWVKDAAKRYVIVDGATTHQLMVIFENGVIGTSSFDSMLEDCLKATRLQSDVLDPDSIPEEAKHEALYKAIAEGMRKDKAVGYVEVIPAYAIKSNTPEPSPETFNDPSKLFRTVLVRGRFRGTFLATPFVVMEKDGKTLLVEDERLDGKEMHPKGAPYELDRAVIEVNGGVA